MKRIVTAYGSFATGTELADAVTRYGVALARRHTVDVVDLPFVTEDGPIERVQLRVGWLCDFATVSMSGAPGELVEVDTLIALIRRTESVEGRRTPQVLVASVSDVRAADGNWEGII